jgi:hypothetical protein
VSCRGVRCVCEDLEVAAQLAEDGAADISAVAWSPRLGRYEERVAIARGGVVTMVAFRSGEGGYDERLSGNEGDDDEGSGPLEVDQVLQLHLCLGY